jgi:hypothetical protein
MCSPHARQFRRERVLLGGFRHRPTPPPGHAFQNILPMGGRVGERAGAGTIAFAKHQKAPAPGAWSEGRPGVRHAGGIRLFGQQGEKSRTPIRIT